MKNEREFNIEEKEYDGEGVVKLHPLIFFVLLVLAAGFVVRIVKSLFF